MAGSDIALGPDIVALGDRRFRVERGWGDLPASKGRVTDVAVDPRGHVFALFRYDALVAPPGPAVMELSPDGALLAQWGTGLLRDAHMLHAAADGRLLLVDRDGHAVVITDRSGTPMATLGRRDAPLEPFNHPTAVAVARDGTIYVADGYAGSLVHRFAPDGTPRGRFGGRGSAPGQFLVPHGIWVLPDGRVAVCDRENNRVQLFMPDGNFLDAVTGFFHPMNIWGDGEGRLYVTDQVPSLTMLAPDGTVLGVCAPRAAHGLGGDAARGILYLAENGPGRINRLMPL